MAHQRNFPRSRKRVPLTLGGSKTFTKDLSAGGFSAELTQALPVGSAVSGAMEIGAGTYPYTGQVAWAKAGDMRIMQRARVGVRFTGVPNAFFTDCADLLKG
jgi:hypothetical protein